MTESQAYLLLVAVADLIFFAKCVALGVGILIGQSFWSEARAGRNSELV